MNIIVVWIVCMSCVYWSCHWIEIFVYTTAECMNRVLIWTIHLSYVYWLCNKIDIFRLIAAKYLDRILVGIIHPLCVYPLCDHIQVFASNPTNDRWEFSFESFIFYVFIDHLMESKSCFSIEQNILIESSYDWFVSDVFIHRRMNPLSSYRYHEIFETNSNLPCSCLKRLPII